MGRWLVIAIVLCAGCIEPELVQCGENDCAAGSTCMANGYCATTEQLSACDGKVDATDCIVGPSSGKCVSGACILAVCGNGILEPGEVCDDGNRISGDGCSYDCLSNETCGNGYIDYVTGELCDDGNTIDGDGCEHDCKFPGCGNGILDPGEVCDDGNRVDGDGCSRDCMSNETCGNGIRDPGEECDDGNLIDHDGCQSNCKVERCGDGIVDPPDVHNAFVGEQCDDGNVDNTDACLNTCKNASCGDGFAWAGHEACDDGNKDNTDDCTNACEFPRCGDGFTWVNHEQCDDANSVDNDCCSNNCTLPVCGDGVRQCTETCDEGDQNGPTGLCRNNCQLSCPVKPAGIQFLGTPALVGDSADPISGVGFLDAAFGGSTYAIYGSESGTVKIVGYNYLPRVIDLSNDTYIAIEQWMITDTSQLSGGLTEPVAPTFAQDNLDWNGQPTYCSATGAGTWVPQLTLTITDACNDELTYHFSDAAGSVTSSSWPVCGP